MMYCIKNAHCLKNKYGIKALKTYIKFVIEKNITYSNRNTYTFYTDRDSDVFKIAIKNKKNSKDESEDCPYINLYIYKIDPNGRDIVTKFCLWMCLKQNYKQEDGFYYFKTSSIKQINKGKCSVKDPNGELGGNYLSKLANSINKIFKVKHSTLHDESSLELAKGKIIKLKTLKLLQYQKTWYERVIGFKLDNKRIYQLAKLVKPDHIVRITADCPVIDPSVIDLVIKAHLAEGADYTSNTLEIPYPDGQDVEVFKFSGSWIPLAAHVVFSNFESCIIRKIIGSK